MFKSTVPALFMASCLPATLAATCSAVGYLTSNSVVGLGPQGGMSGVFLYNGDGDKIGELTGDAGACTDIADISGDGLDDTFGWAATCNINSFRECHGSYADAGHIDGLPPTGADSDFYGIGIATDAQCKIEFEC
ncbi:uncharacterized protein APUU_20013A [Aspergillus puulaauensis]|uniref:Uncharacterized protein n=1 Tax=Aspergillus puulaauensis TaxID=1220207 RepID=A0A7R7XE98_9EURO|nr:uncharacterized protein APUU_20013A [Aspergillus puulaauensis]BCS19581.1 hypothetical protein APUU_20013A [Aspergillus puulaauensis]